MLQWTWGYRYLLSGISGSYGLIFYFNILRNLHIVFHSGRTNIHAHQQCTKAHFFHILNNTCYLLSFWLQNSERCEMTSQCGFDLHFPDGWWYWASFHVSVGHMSIFFGKMTIQISCPFLNQIAFIEWYAFSVYFGY